MKLCAQNVSPLENHLWWIFWVHPRKKISYFVLFFSTGWSLYYLLSSIAGGELPWSSCNNEWNTEFCAKTCNDSLLYSNNTDQNFTIPCNLTRSPAKEYFKYDLDFRNLKKNQNNRSARSYSTPPNFRVCARWKVPAKWFKIYHILYMRKPKVAFSYIQGVLEQRCLSGGKYYRLAQIRAVEGQN